MSDPQSEMNAALEKAQRADQKKREAAAALRTRQHEYQTANLRGRQQQIERARAALEAAQTTYEAAKRDVQRLYDKAEEVRYYVASATKPENHSALKLPY